MTPKAVRQILKTAFDRIRNEKFKQKLLQAVPFWIASLISGLIAVFYSRIFAFLEGVTFLIMHYSAWLIFLLTPGCFVIAWWLVVEMDLACCGFFEEADIAVFAAAVADYRPGYISKQKIKKDEPSFIIKMVKNVDIAYEFGKVKSSGQLSIGFALETNDELTHATQKLLKKNFDMVVLNSMNDSKATFGFDTNKISITRNDFTQKEFPLKHKNEVAKDIVAEVYELWLNRKANSGMIVN